MAGEIVEQIGKRALGDMHEDVGGELFVVGGGVGVGLVEANNWFFASVTWLLRSDGACLRCTVITMRQWQKSFGTISRPAGHAKTGEEYQYREPVPVTCQCRALYRLPS